MHRRSRLQQGGGTAAGRKLLADDPGITAIIALNDLMAAAGVLAAAKAVGREVPADLSVVGFDDLPFAVDLSPALTTVRLPLRTMGERATRLLLSAPAPSPRIVPVPAELVVRASAATAQHG